jgi:hypothetical protein
MRGNCWLEPTEDFETKDPSKAVATGQRKWAVNRIPACVRREGTRGANVETGRGSKNCGATARRVSLPERPDLGFPARPN